MESMDYIEPDVSENYKYLQEHNTSTTEQLAQQPPQFQPVQEQQQRPRREVVPKVPPQEPLGTTTKAIPLRPPPGLEQVPVQPPLGTTSKAPPAKAPPIAPPPQPGQPQPLAGPQQHRPVGKHYNPARPRPQQAGAILEQPTDMTTDNNDTEIDPYNCYNPTMETKVLHFVVNEDKKKKLLQQELMLDHAVLLPSYHYHDNIEQYDKQEVLTAMKKDLDKLRQKDMYEECDKSTLTPEQLRKVFKTHWVVGDRPDPTTTATATATTGEVHASELRARFVAKGYSQHADDPMVECYAATPSSTSLKALTATRNTTRSSNYMPRHLYSLHQHTTTTNRRNLRPTSRVVLQQPNNTMEIKEGNVRTTYIPKVVATTLGGSTTPTNLRQCKADRCLWTTPGLGVLIYADDLLLVGETTRIQQFISTLKATFTLKHVTTLSKEQDVRFLGKRLHTTS